MKSESSTRRVVFLDRDGVLNVDKYLTYLPDQFVLIGGVVEGLSCLQALGFEFIVITNQSAVGQGVISEEEVKQFNQILLDKLSRNGITVADVFMCPHDPAYGQGEYRKQCACRKPRPGMFFEAAKKYSLNLPDCYYIGDKKADVVAGFNAGCRTILVETGILDDDAIYPGVSPDFRVKDLPKAAQIIAGELALEQMYLTRNFISPFDLEVLSKFCKSDS